MHSYACSGPNNDVYPTSRHNRRRISKGWGGGRICAMFWWGKNLLSFLSLSLMSLREAGYYFGEAANSRQVIGSIVALNLILHHYVT